MDMEFLLLVRYCVCRWQPFLSYEGFRCPEGRSLTQNFQFFSYGTITLWLWTSISTTMVEWVLDRHHYTQRQNNALILIKGEHWPRYEWLFCPLDVQALRLNILGLKCQCLNVHDPLNSSPFGEGLIDVCTRFSHSRRRW